MKSAAALMCLTALWCSRATGFKHYVLRDLGCWRDTGSRAIPSIDNRLQGGYKNRGDAIQQCAHAASILGYAVFAVQDGGWCASSRNAKDTYKKYGTSDQCSSDGKGGAGANQVYEVDTVIKVNYRPVGCFKDTDSRAIPTIETRFVDLHDSYRSRSDAIGKCARNAAALGNRVFAIQHGGWCASSDGAENTYNKYGRSQYCYDNGKGGSWANAVYEITDMTLISLTRLGCFADKVDRALPTLEVPEVLAGSYKSRPYAIEQCVRFASGLGFLTVGIQDGGWCAAGPNYNRYGHSTACKDDSKGGPSANEVFTLSVEFIDLPPTGLPVHQLYHLNNLGCWTDHENRAIPVRLEGQEILIGEYQTRKDAIQRCAQAAASRGYNVIGVKDGGQCWSGANARDTYRKYGTSTKCGGNGKGGSGANQVYEINTIFHPIFTGLGCFRDTRNRAIEMIENTQPSLSDDSAKRAYAIQKCAIAAAGIGFEVFGVQNGGQCSTSSNAESRYMMYGPANNCGYGRGGAWSNSVYKILLDNDFYIEDLGCWADDTFRTIPSIEEEVPEFVRDPNYQQREDAFAKCAREAFKRGFKIFALQHGGWCATSADARDTYRRLGPSQKCGKGGKGGSWANQVYAIVPQKLP